MKIITSIVVLIVSTTLVVAQTPGDVVTKHVVRQQAKA